MGFSWRLQPLSVTRSHVFIFVVDEVRVRAVCNKAVCVCVCVSPPLCARVCVQEGVLSQGAKRTCSCATWGWLKHDWGLPGKLRRGKRERTSSDAGVRPVPRHCSSYSNMNSCGTELICLFRVATVELDKGKKAIKTANLHLALTVLSCVFEMHDIVSMWLMITPFIVNNLLIAFFIVISFLKYIQINLSLSCLVWFELKSSKISVTLLRLLLF